LFVLFSGRLMAAFGSSVSEQRGNIQPQLVDYDE
jgi:hypothetical protein